MLALLLALSISLAAPNWPDLIIQPPRIGLVPSLATVPADLPKAVINEAGDMLVPALRARYVAAQVSALYRLPKLNQEALDLAVKAEKDLCDIRVEDAKAGEATWTDRLRAGVAWGLGGVLVGGLAVAYIKR